MTDTARFALPLLHAGQAQKELSHNEALMLIDALLHGCVEAAGVDLPPDMPMAGECWIVGTDPVEDWADAADALAVWTENGWRFVVPREGMTMWVRADALFARYGDTGWMVGSLVASELRIDGEKVVAVQQPAIADPAGGTTIDTEARTAIADLLDALRTHGLIAIG